jgi:ribose transport system ATP-binding protein
MDLERQKESIMDEPLLRMQNIVKSFPGVLALKDVGFELRSGEIHAIIGENGAGKSTLMKILLGIYQPDEGSILLKGKPFQAKNPRHAQDQGISMIYQEFNLVPDLTVAENIFLAREQRKFHNLLIDDKTMIAETKKFIESLGLAIDAHLTINELSVAEKQMVEIIKALVVKSDILVLDEPTSALTEKEVQRLFSILMRLKSEGVGIIYISHRMEELNTIADRVTVLRDGTFVATHEWKSVTVQDLIRMMIGRKLTDLFPYSPREPGEVVFKAQHINHSTFLKDVSLEVRKGEILGLAGLMGAGRSEFARAVFGADRKDSGTIWIDGKEITVRAPHDAIRHGIAYLPEDRKKDGLFLELDIYDNILAGNLPQYSNKNIVNENVCRTVVDKRIAELNVKTHSPKKIVKYLSGGNQQKVLLSRWFCKQAKLIIFDEPTRGIDVGAKSEIYQLMNKLKQAGAAIIMISSEMPEILGMSDRIAVMYEGRITGELTRAQATSEKIMALASNIVETA